MKHTLLRVIGPTRKHPSRTQLRKLIILFLQRHVSLRKLTLHLAKPSTNKVQLNQLAKHLILNKMLHPFSMVPINKTRQSRTVSMHVHIHKQPAIRLLIKLSKLRLLVIPVFIVIYKQLRRSDRWPDYITTYVLSIED
jgi:hypothetical protein